MWNNTLDDVMEGILQIIMCGLLIIAAFLFFIGVPVALYHDIKETKAIEDSVQFCEHEWEIVGHKYSTEAVCKKCFISVDPSVLQAYAEVTNGLK